MAKSRWIQDAIKSPGAFTRQAKDHGMTVPEYAEAVTSGKIKASVRTKRRATLAQTLRAIARKRRVKS